MITGKAQLCAVYSQASNRLASLRKTQKNMAVMSGYKKRTESVKNKILMQFAMSLLWPVLFYDAAVSNTTKVNPPTGIDWFMVNRVGYNQKVLA